VVADVKAHDITHHTQHHRPPSHESRAMTRIDRPVRTVAIAIVSALLVACGSDEATAPRQEQPPETEQPAPLTPVGAWASQRIDGKALPARLAGGTEPDGLQWELRATYDSLVVRADGRWVQRVRVEQTQSDGFNFGGTYGDRGTWTRQGNTIHFESDWIENVAFDGELLADGTLVVVHDFLLDDETPAMRRDMKR
jgi:hypothetical protein